MRYQAKIEEGLNTRLQLKLKPGDLILTSFDSLPGSNKKKSKVFERLAILFDGSCVVLICLFRLLSGL
jgi:hypothetical protein